MSYLKEGIQRGLISISEDGKQIFYLNTRTSNKRRNLSNPEERVQVETYLKLIFHYKYPAHRIKLYETVTMGSGKKEADIIVYQDDDCIYPHILIECKSQDVSEQAFLQAVEQAYSYAYALPNNVKFVWVTSGLKDEFFEVDKSKRSRVTQPDIPQFGVSKLSNYRYAYEAHSLRDLPGQQQFDDLSVIGEDELTKRFKQAHDSLWAGGQLNPSEAFDELDKLIFCKIWDERIDRKPGDPYDFQAITVDKQEIINWERKGEDELRRAILDEENKRLTNRMHALYEEGRRRDPDVFRDNIRLTPEKIRTVVGYLAYINLGDTDLDSKGRAFETFMHSFFRGSFGQYFTPRAIVDFTVKVLPIKNDSVVLDTSCGSGGFLLYVLNKIRKQADEIYPKFKTEPSQKLRHYKYWHDFASKNLFGIEINEQISRAAKMNMIIHDDGHTNVITADGLLDEHELEKATKNDGFKYGNFDFIVTNPPFGSIVRQTEKAYLREYKLGRKEEDWLAVAAKPETNRESQSTEVLFIEQCNRFLKEGGYLAIVIPDSILTNSSLQYVRDKIEDMFRIVAIISLPQSAFAANGAGVKSSVLFLKKHQKTFENFISENKYNIKNGLLKDSNYYDKITKWESEKKLEIKKLERLVLLDNPLITKSDLNSLIKEKKDLINEKVQSKINQLKDQMNDQYIKLKNNLLKDYSIFMAIAEDIGYDATGKKTKKNELDRIAVDLEQFINNIEKNEI
jgi:type I restriction enzyme M protein